MRNLTKNRKPVGAVTALVIILILVVILLGTGFFVWQMLIGGGKELQNAIDSGNLNVAKQVLKSPSVALNSGAEQEEFGDLVDNNQVTLLNFNRLVGKAVLAQVNATSMGSTTLAVQHAQQLTDLIEGQNGIAQRLRDAIVAQNALVGHFAGISNANSTRMFGQDGQINHVQQELDFSFMARGMPSNVYFDPGAIPSNYSWGAGDISRKRISNKDYDFLAGYVAVSSAGKSNVTTTTWAVPMRPGEQPHLVALEDFGANKRDANPLLTAASTDIIPNAFKTGGTTTNNRTQTAAQMRSTAVLGSLQYFPVQINRGVLVVDNRSGGFVAFNGTFEDRDIFRNELMDPNCVEVFTIHDGQGDHCFMSSMAPCNAGNPISQQLVDMARQHTSEAGLPMFSSMIQSFLVNIRQCSTQAAPNGDDLIRFHLMGRTTPYISQHATRNVIMANGTTLPRITSSKICTNSDWSGSANTCTQNEDNMRKAWGNPQGAISLNGVQMMALEQMAIEVAGAFTGPGSGCVTVFAPQHCTGIKKYDPQGSYSYSEILSYGEQAKNDPNYNGPFSYNPTINELMHIVTPNPNDPADDPHGSRDTGQISDLRTSITERLHQMKPNISDSEVDQFFENKIPFNKVSYFYQDGNGNIVNHVDASPPYLKPFNVPTPHSSTGLPDGPLMVVGNDMEPCPRIVDNPFLMWECGDGCGNTHNLDQAQWWPSSGIGHLLGVLRFGNCPRDGGNFCCP